VKHSFNGAFIETLKMEKQRYWKLLNGITDGLRPIF
jgi:hypothetical protein